MTPIEKNVIVTDEHGNIYEATYPKRAKGLVKNGRARFVDKNTICLACPPNQNLEDIKMNENITEKSTILSMEYVLKQIEAVLFDTSHITKAFEKLGEMGNSLGPDDYAGQAKAEAIGNVVSCRETTNQQLLKLYEKMYDDLKKNYFQQDIE